VSLRWPDLSIRTRLVLGTSILLAAASLAPLLVLPDRLEAHGRQELERRALDIAQAFGAASEVALDFGDRQRAAQVLQGLASAGAATYGILLKGDETALASWGPSPPSVLPPTPSGATRRYLGEQLHVRVPIFTPSGERGAIQIGLELGDLRHRREESRGLVASTALTVFLAGLAALILIATLLTEPVRTLTALAKRISLGDEGAANFLATGRRDETGAVAIALESVVGRLAAQRAMLQSQSEASSEGILTLDLAGRIITYNHRLREIWDLPAAALEGAGWCSLRPRLERGLVDRLPTWLLADKPALPGPEPSSFDLVTTDDRTLTVQAATVRRSGGDPLGLGLYFGDITRQVKDRRRIEELAQGLERRVDQRTGELAAANQELALRLAELRQTQEQLVVADRRISVGRLAAGVAHEINNPISYVLANLTCVLVELADLRGELGATDQTVLRATESKLDEMVRALADARDGAERVTNIVRSLTAFSHGDEDGRAPVQLASAMRAALGMAGNEIRHRARLVQEFGEAPAVEANEVRVSQVFLNLLINAAQAIAPGAADRNTITVTVGTDAAGWAFAEVGDSGSGISPDIRGRIFDPFFTTKAQGEGTGLGLSISQGIVGSFGGSIEVSTQPGRGSTFRVRFPPSPSAADHQPPETSAALSPPPSSILVVDDEPLVAHAMRRLLQKEHAVTVALGSAEALERILAGERYDHILCDLMMPMMSGMELHARLAQIDPGQARAMVFMTGGTFTDAAEAFVEANRKRTIFKPVDLDKLWRAIHARIAS
jgi:signal transduction histidine kinase/CheY-like chemotaxis protein